VDYHLGPFDGHDEELMVLLKIYPNLWDIGSESTLISQNIQLQRLVDLNQCEIADKVSSAFSTAKGLGTDK
jgi:hypothetical protein